MIPRSSSNSLPLPANLSVDHSTRINSLIASRLVDSPVSSIEAATEILRNQPSDFADTISNDLEKKIRDTWRYEGIEPDEKQISALKMLSMKSNRAVKRLGTAQLISRSDYAVLESVIMADGTRPSLFVENDGVDYSNPSSGEYSDDIKRNLSYINQICRATGRIQPDLRGGPNLFIGTGVLASKNGAVLTNMHVAESIIFGGWSKYVQYEVQNNAYRIYSGLAIDFLGETKSGLRKRLFPIIEIRPLDLVRTGLSTLDVAVMQLGDPAEGTQVPDPLPFSADIDAEYGALATTCVVGFPGRPTEGKTTEEMEMERIIEIIFGNKFGLKRFAPGTVNLPLGQVEDDQTPWIFGHDSSTLGGSSGSAICNFTGKAYAFGVHFMGRRINKKNSNLAHALSPSQVKEALAKMGIELT